MNGVNIRSADYFGYLELLESQRRTPLSEAQKREVLDRMIQEAVLIQRGLELGLGDSDPRVRRAIADAMIQSVTAELSSEQVSEKELQSFFTKNRDYFAKSPRIRLQRLAFRSRGAGDNPMQRAHRALRRLEEGADFAAVGEEYADPDVVAPPDTLLPLPKLAEYIGPQLLEEAEQLEAGALSAPLKTRSGVFLLWVVEKQPRQYAAFAKVEEEVRREYLRRKGDEALQRYLQGLVKGAKLRIREPLDFP